jgi:hypothetical protein
MHGLYPSTDIGLLKNAFDILKIPRVTASASAAQKKKHEDNKRAKVHS